MYQMPSTTPRLIVITAVLTMHAILLVSWYIDFQGLKHCRLTARMWLYLYPATVQSDYNVLLRHAVPFITLHETLDSGVDRPVEAHGHQVGWPVCVCSLRLQHKG